MAAYGKRVQSNDCKADNYGGSLAASQAFHGDSIGDAETPRTIYVGNLDPNVTEDLVTTLFSQIGPVTKCKIIYEGMGEPYSFLEFSDHNAAAQALTAMNHRILLEREMRVNWATTPGSQQRIDTSTHFHIFVGDLSPEVDNKALKDAFTPFGTISDAKVIRDLSTLKSKGYGFVSFVVKEDAERAIEQMNGQWLGRRTIRTNWATRKPPNSQTQQANSKPLNYDEVYAQSGPQNATVYVGGITPNTTEEDIRTVFLKFGNVTEVRIFKQQGYAFVRYDTKDCAAQAICNGNGADVCGATVKCSWGRQGDNVAQANAGGPKHGGYGYGYGGQGFGGGNGGQGQAGPGAGAATNAYWQQYYNYYNNPQLMQQWQQYWAQQAGPHQ